MWDGRGRCICHINDINAIFFAVKWQEYQVAYVIIKTGNAPRPGTWALEKSIDGGKTFKPWQYFATTNSECLNFFGISSLLQSFKDDTTVTCTTSYSHVPPFENGEVMANLDQ